MLNRKGFLGPIGDDLPSLIPLLFALVIFFSTFTFAFKVFDDRNQDFDDDLTVLRISRVLKTNGYINSFENFEELCQSLGITHLNFRAGLTNAETAREQYINDYLGGNESEYKRLDIFSIKFYTIDEGGETKIFECTDVESDPEDGIDNDRDGEVDEERENLTLESAVGKTLITRVYPVVLEDNRIVKPMHLVVIAWR